MLEVGDAAPDAADAAVAAAAAADAAADAAGIAADTSPLPTPPLPTSYSHLPLPTSWKRLEIKFIKTKTKKTCLVYECWLEICEISTSELNFRKQINKSTSGSLGPKVYDCCVHSKCKLDIDRLLNAQI